MSESAERGRSAASIPCLVEDTELIGEYKRSGFREPVSLVRQAAGQVIRLSHLLYLVAAEAPSVSPFLRRNADRWE